MPLIVWPGSNVMDMGFDFRSIVTTVVPRLLPLTDIVSPDETSLNLMLPLLVSV